MPRVSNLRHLRALVSAGLALLALAAPVAARADSVTGATWGVFFNCPDQTSAVSSIAEDEFLLRDRWIARIDALKKGDWACLSTYTFSGPSLKVGAAGPMLVAVSNALARGASVGFVVDYGVNIASNFAAGCSLKSLSKRKTNPLRLSQSPKGGIMHDKMGVFWYASQKRAWVLSGSWNFTGGASSQQWNVLVELQNNALATACSNELAQLLAGHFHADAAKSHAWDGATFTLESNRTGRVRFAPYPSGLYGGDNALRDITNVIASAQSEIFFALNKLTRMDVANELVKACNRGVIVHGVIPLSDCGHAGGDSWDIARFLSSPTNYATPNRVRLYTAFATAAHDSRDAFNRDLVHTKYMVVDPRGKNPWVVQGSPNWTAAALVQTAANDENLQFIPHAAIARAFMDHFHRVCNGLAPWCELVGDASSPSGLALRFWTHETNRAVRVQSAASLSAPAWTTWTNLPAARSGTVPIPRTFGSPAFFRISQP